MEDSKNSDHFSGFFDRILKNFDIKYWNKRPSYLPEDKPCAIKNKDKYTIYIDGKTSLWEKRLICAHELAHILFGHLEGSVNTEIGEQEAQIFAGCLMALMIFDLYKPLNKEERDSQEK